MKDVKAIITCIRNAAALCIIVAAFVLFFRGEVLSAAAGDISVETPIEIKPDDMFDDRVSYGTERFYHFKADKNGYISFQMKRTDYKDDSSLYYIYNSANKCIGKYANQTKKTDQCTFTVQNGQDYYVLVEYYTRHDYEDIGEKSKEGPAGGNSGAAGGGAATGAGGDAKNVSPDVVRTDISKLAVSYRVIMDFYEYENIKSGKNSDISGADTLPEGSRFLGALGDGEDYYRYDASKNCCVTIKFEAVSKVLTGYPRWVYTAYNSKMDKLYTLNTDKSCVLTQQYVLKKGESVFIGLGDKRAAKGKLYAITVTVTELDLIEAEPNNDTSKANAVEKDKIYYGTLNEKTDDHYVFSSNVTKPIKIALRFAETLECPCRMVVTDASGLELAAVTADIYKAAALKFYAKKGQKYYIRVYHRNKGGMAEFADHGISVGVMYSLNIDNRKEKGVI